MKKNYFLILFVICFQLAKAGNEVPNPGFENWAAGNPAYWFTSNITGFGIPITQYSPGHLSTSAAKGQPVITLLTGDTLPPLLIPGDASSGIPITVNYSTLEFYYQCNLTGNDVFEVLVIIFDGSNNIIGNADEQITVNASGWTKRTIAINYTNPTATAVKALIEVLITPDYLSGRSYPYPASSFIIDDVALAGTVGVEEIGATGKLQVFPVPAHDRLMIKGEITKGKPVHYLLTDVSGRIVMERNSNSSNSHFIEDELNLASIAPGIYSLMIKSQEEAFVHKVIVQ